MTTHTNALESVASSIITARPNHYIFREDYRKFLREQEAGSVDLVLTAPPFAINREVGFKFGVSMDFGKWDHESIDLNIFADLVYKSLRQGGTAIIWYDVWKITDLENALREAGFKMLRLIIWQKANPVPLNQNITYLSNSREIAIAAVKGGKPVFNGKYDNGVYNYPIPRHKGEKIHPMQKPLELFEELVLKHSSEGDKVIDSFVGSGTAALAAIKHNRRFEGCEIDSVYVQAARRRLIRDMRDV